MDGIQLGAGIAVRVKVVVGPGEILAVVAGKVHVVQRVVRWAVDKLFRPGAGNHVAVVDEDGPELDQDEEDGVEVLLHGADEDKDAGRTESVFGEQGENEQKRTGKESTAGTRQRDGKQWRPTASGLNKGNRQHSVTCSGCVESKATYQSTCGEACEHICRRWGGAPVGESSR